MGGHDRLLRHSDVVFDSGAIGGAQPAEPPSSIGLNSAVLLRHFDLMKVRAC